MTLETYIERILACCPGEENQQVLRHFHLSLPGVHRIILDGFFLETSPQDAYHRIQCELLMAAQTTDGTSSTPFNSPSLTRT